MNEFLWVEKYRPNTIEECVLPDRLKILSRKLFSKEKSRTCFVCGAVHW